MWLTNACRRQLTSSVSSQRCLPVFNTTWITLHGLLPEADSVDHITPGNLTLKCNHVFSTLIGTLCWHVAMSMIAWPVSPREAPYTLSILYYCMRLFDICELAKWSWSAAAQAKMGHMSEWCDARWQRGDRAAHHVLKCLMSARHRIKAPFHYFSIGSR